MSVLIVKICGNMIIKIKNHINVTDFVASCFLFLGEDANIAV